MIQYWSLLEELVASQSWLVRRLRPELDNPTEQLQPPLRLYWDYLFENPTRGRRTIPEQFDIHDTSNRPD